MSTIKFPKIYPETKQDEGEDYEPTCKVEIKENCFLLSLITAENQFSYRSMTAIVEALTDIENYYWHERENTKCIRYLITTGEGKKFSNGVDLGSVVETRPKKFLTLFHKMLIKLLKFPMPTIAALNGHCFAGGAVSS
jgi:enoyl-CoA hydratase/carnithine racemase